VRKNYPKIVNAFIILCLLVSGCGLSGKSAPINTGDYRETIRVACVGDSITYGNSIKYRVRDCYPAQLGRLLGYKWQTRNFGVSGATLLKKGDKPYRQQQAFKDALAFNPNVVIIKLGTNDAKTLNWKFKNEFVSDYKDMIDCFAKLPAKPRIWICRPVPAYPARWGITNEVIKNEILPLVDQVADKKHVGLINLYEPLSGKPQYFPDKIHPNAKGAALMAKVIYKAITGKETADVSEKPALPKVLIIGDSISIGYYKPIRQLLEGRVLVYHNPGNAAHTNYGLKKLDEWLGDTHWDVIHFNHGLHDLKHLDENGKPTSVDKGKHQIPLDQYEKNLNALAIRLKKTGAEIIFATTTPVPEGAAGRRPGDAKKYNKVAEKIMKKHGITVNDLYSFALGRLTEIQKPVNVHFNKHGSFLLGEQVAVAVLNRLEASRRIARTRQTSFAKKSTDWNGYEKYDFVVDGRKCWVVVPRVTALGRPWIWRARFFDTEPQTDIAMLRKGFHLAYMDVTEMYGSPVAVAHWNKFYYYLTQKHNLAGKVALECLSRGGLIVYNWTAANSEKVACIYADAPVCDFKSWPGGKGSSKGSGPNWQRCLKAYGLTEEQALAYKHNPIDNLEPLVHADVPLLHVCGDSDKIVPMEENTNILEERYKKLGGRIRIILKKGIGHNPHSLKDPAEIVQFICEHTMQEVVSGGL
jgi:lysophospholipase L1-like esterase